MKFSIIILCFYFSFIQLTHGQKGRDSLSNQLMRSGEDTNKVVLLLKLAAMSQFYDSDTALVLVKDAIRLARKLKYLKGELRGISGQGEMYHLRGELPQALELELEAIQLSQKYYYPDVEAASLTFLATIYLDLAEYRQAIHYLFRAKRIYDNINIKLLTEEAQQIPPYTISNIAYAYQKLNLIDSAMYFYTLSLNYPVNFSDQLRADILTKIGIVQSRLLHYKEALAYFREAIQITESSNDLLNRSTALFETALIFKEQNILDSAIHYGFLAFKNGEHSLYKTVMMDASKLLAKVYKTKENLDSAFYYQQIASEIKDSLFGLDKFQRLQLLNISEQQRIQKLKEQQALSKTRFQLIGLLFSVGIFLLVAFIFWRLNNQQKKVNSILNLKNLQIEQQSESLKKTLYDLNSTQAQLIQSEKMASLGELTLGIAHEIQNPLNFVNNFSDVNTELIEELQKELHAGNAEEAILISNEVKENEQKINHHGKRADAIVKGMLQHSSASTGEMELTDINALAEKYMRLSYQAFRSKYKLINATLQTHFLITTL